MEMVADQTQIPVSLIWPKDSSHFVKCHIQTRSNLLLFGHSYFFCMSYFRVTYLEQNMNNFLLYIHLQNHTESVTVFSLQT